MNRISRALAVALSLWTAGPALAAPPAPVSPPYTPPPVNVSLRPPTPTDDTTAGYIASGSVNAIVVGGSGGSGYVAPTATLSGGACTKYGALSVAFANGVISAIADDGTTSGCTSAPTVTITDSAGTGATGTARINASGSLWAFNGTVYEAKQVVAGKAVWQPVVAANGLPGDVVTTPLALYGMKALRTAWLNGNWIDVATSPGGTVNTIKFINGQPDIATLASVIGTGLGYVSKWYDQSGNAFDAAQATAASQPVIRIDIGLGGVPSVVLDSSINSSPTQKFLTLPSGVTASGQADSAFVVGRSYSARRPAEFVQLTNASYPQTLSANTPPFSQSTPNLGYWYGSATFASGGAPMTPSVMGWTSSTAGQSVYQNDGIGVTGAQAANTMVGGYIGASYQGSTQYGTGYAEISAVAIYARGLAPADTTALRASLTRLFGVMPQVSDVIDMAGDSITEGQCNTALQNYPRKMSGLLSAPAQVYDTGYYGSTTSNRITDYPTYDVPLYNPKARNNVFSYFGGTNDIAGGSTAAATYANLTQIASMAHATGYKVVLGTMLPRNGMSASANTMMASYNALIRANSGGTYGVAGQWDALADFNADTTMGVTTAPSLTTIYCDGIHPIENGYGYLAPIATKAVQSLLH